jgi:hypothetical protein
MHHWRSLHDVLQRVWLHHLWIVHPRELMDGNFWICFIVMDLCLVATLWWKFVDLLFFVFIKLCFDASSEKQIVLICYVLKTCSGYGWWGPLFQQHLGGWISRARPFGVTGSQSRATSWVYTESFGLVAPVGLARLLVPVTPNDLARLDQNFLCKLNVWRD